MEPKRHEVRGVEVEAFETAPARASNDVIDIIPGTDAAGLKEILGAPSSLSKTERNAFDALYHAVCADVKPTRFIERNWCRDVTSKIWRLHKLESAREAFIQNRLDLALAALLVERTSENIMALMERVRGGEVEAKNQISDLKVKFEITDGQLRSYVEMRHRNELSGLDQEMRTIEMARDRIIEFIEKRRYMTMANLRFLADMPKSIETQISQVEEM